MILIIDLYQSLLLLISHSFLIIKGGGEEVAEVACSVQFKDAAVEVAEGVEEGAYSMQSKDTAAGILEEEAEGAY